MSAETILLIRCDELLDDGERCHTEWGPPIPVRTHTELRRHLKMLGWRRTRAGDRCPDCVKRLEPYGGDVVASRG